ncbi:MAG: hypothetical protein J1F63_00405 [Oscillospiraceae bacterium]|nr:hypothetical protein [Oscillospiraceae bacterium]
MAKKPEPQLEAEKKPEAKYTKARLIASKRFADRRDVLSAALEQGKEYTLGEAEDIINKFLKGKVK